MSVLFKNNYPEVFFRIALFSVTLFFLPLFSFHAYSATHEIEFEQVFNGELGTGYVNCVYTETSEVKDHVQSGGTFSILQDLSQEAAVDGYTGSAKGFPAFVVEGDTYNFNLKQGSVDYSGIGAVAPTSITVSAGEVTVPIVCGVDLGGTCAGNCEITKNVPVLDTDDRLEIKDLFILIADSDSCDYWDNVLGDYPDPERYFLEPEESYRQAVIKGVPYAFKTDIDTNSTDCTLGTNSFYVEENQNGSAFVLKTTRSVYWMFRYAGLSTKNKTYSYELPLLESALDADCDGILNIHDSHPTDYLNDGLLDDNGLTCDGDLDGIVNDNDEFPNNSSEWLDTDGDEWGDNSDPYPLLVDGDNDQLIDSIDNCPTTTNGQQHDNDDDDIGNACDDDVDGDGVSNGTDTHPLNALLWTDTDNDGVEDDNCPSVANFGQSDNDGDGVGNACDPDVDGDGINNGQDSHPLNPNYWSDSDRDLVNSENDNCVGLSNPNQSDADNDGLGDVCDDNDDNDLFPDADDPFPLDSNLPQYVANHEINLAGYIRTGESTILSGGDINSDGVIDIIAGTTNNLLVISGVDRTIMHQFPKKGFGAFAAIGDINNDSYDDVGLIGMFDDDQVNSLRVYSGSDGSVLFDLDPTAQEFKDIEPAGDINNDGFDDFILVVFDETNEKNIARVFSGATQALLVDYVISSSDFPESYFRFWINGVAGMGDVNDDGFDDFAIGYTPGKTGGFVSMVSGSDGVELYRLEGDYSPAINFFGYTPERTQDLGLTVTRYPDINDDGVNEFIALSFDHYNCGLGCAHNWEGGTLFVSIFSGVDGQELERKVIYSAWGHDSAFNAYRDSFSSAGDINEDGFQDILLGRYFSEDAEISLGPDHISGLKVHWARSNCSGSPDNSASKLSVLGDIDGDGYSERLLDLKCGKIWTISMSPDFLDWDGDDIANSLDHYPMKNNLAGDLDQDGTDEAVDNCQFIKNPMQHDNDEDGVGNACDWDIDGDGVENSFDQYPLNRDLDTDEDYDQVNDPEDNCRGIYNPGQSDNDNDGEGNACDSDIDGDGVDNGSDQFPLNPTLWLDTDGDLINDSSDNCPTIINYKQHDNDNDGIGNACDNDWDGDGIDNDLDNYPLNPDLN